MVKAKKYQFLAIAILVIASLSTFVVFIYDDAFCVTGYGVEGITYLNTISSASDERVLFVFAGIIGLFFAILLSFSKTKFWFFAVNMVMLMCMAIPMSMFSAAPFYQVIYESIFLCGHRVLLSTVLIFYLYWGAVAIYLLKLDKT
ncbi:hypothetical protein [Acinetobacter sp. WCHAc060025]|uniref:hypothetical protein n=1 Tax=Acinetobacter sp. WCHAc060025 TaxID=2518625 RepID=UPI001022CA38|nr:hypothetical protein [Acinetobacter sp. WCHAc060025]RZG72262.1 hypothetical protein EXE09_17500 [Acinetobacter sp. WCHAc060025]